MTTLDDRRRALEEDYFRKKDQELVEKLRRQADALSGRESMARSIGIDDDELLKELEERGFTASTVSLLQLMPLIEVAWAEGRVSDAERTMIVEVARAHGIAQGTHADAQLGEWLERQPSDEVFTSALRVMRAVFETLPSDQRKHRFDSLVTYCTALASASGGIFGFGSISAQEADVMRRVAAALEQTHAEAAKKVVEHAD